MAAIVSVGTFAKEAIETTVKEAVKATAKEVTKTTAIDAAKVAPKEVAKVAAKDGTGITARDMGKDTAQKEVQEQVAKEAGTEVINNNTEGEEGAGLAIGAIKKGKKIDAVKNRPNTGEINSDPFKMTPAARRILDKYHISPKISPSDVEKLGFPFPFPDECPINNLTIRNDGVTVHSTTGVEFVREEYLDPDTGEIKEGSFPVFDSVFDTTISEDLYDASDSAQFADCNKQLQQWVNENPDLAKEKFTPEQLEVIKNNPIEIKDPNGNTITVWKNPPGLTWHHNQKPGLMQLVDTKIHAATGHTGGQAIWGNRAKHTTKEN
jgi:hypothetical protein